MKFNKLASCKTCESREYCRQSAYPDYEEHIEGNKKTIELSEETEKNMSIQTIETNTLAGLFSEMLFYLQNDVESVYKIFYFTEKLKEILHSNPKTLKIALLKIVHPHKSFTELAEEINCGKPLIHYHLARAREIFPEIDKAFIIDKRKYPKSFVRKRKVLTIVKAV